MSSIIVSVLALLAAFAPLVVEYFQRRWATTPVEQSSTERQQEIAGLPARIVALEAAGDLAGADALRRRLRDLTASDSERDAD